MKKLTTTIYWLFLGGTILTISDPSLAASLAAQEESAFTWSLLQSEGKKIELTVNAQPKEAEFIGGTLPPEMNERELRISTRLFAVNLDSNLEDSDFTTAVASILTSDGNNFADWLKRQSGLQDPGKTVAEALKAADPLADAVFQNINQVSDIFNKGRTEQPSIVIANLTGSVRANNEQELIKGIEVVIKGTVVAERGFLESSFGKISTFRPDFSLENFDINFEYQDEQKKVIKGTEPNSIQVENSKSTQSDLTVLSFQGRGVHLLKSGPVNFATFDIPLNLTAHERGSPCDSYSYIDVDNVALKLITTANNELILNNFTDFSSLPSAPVTALDSPVGSGCDDFGDAPDSYRTLGDSDGPRYQEGDLQRLGKLWDNEEDGRASVRANGDDTRGGCADCNISSDDEDGVVFGNNWVDVKFNITRPEANNYQLRAWWDKNNNGQFDHPGDLPPNTTSDELYINDLLTLTPGSHLKRYTLPFNPKDYYSRFRLTWEPTEDVKPWGEVLSSDGISHGEVEDYPPRIPESSSTLSLLVLGLLGTGSKLIDWYRRK